MREDENDSKLFQPVLLAVEVFAVSVNIVFQREQTCKDTSNLFTKTYKTSLFYL